MSSLALAADRAGVAARRRRSTAIQPAGRDKARPVHWAAALLAFAALADSAIEHYRGQFHNKTMYVPLAVSALTLAASLRDATSTRDVGDDGHAADIVDGLAVATGIIGTGFHLHNILKRPGGVSWLNLFYAAPIGAPAALSLAGVLRRAGTRARRGKEVGRWSPGRVLAGLVSLGLVGTTAEAGLLHFRGAYHDPAMLIPVTAPPVAAALLARAALAPRRSHRAARWSLRLLAGIGLLGSAFHAYGIQRNMGGWRNWSQNLLNGPPLPAPPAFTALAIAGLAALRRIERSKR